MRGRFVFVGATCAIAVAAACTGDDAIFTGGPDAGTGDVPVVPTTTPTTPPRPDAALPRDATPEEDATADAWSDAQSDAAGDAAPPLGLGPDGVIRGLITLRLSYVGRLPEASTLCPAYATVVNGCCVWSGNILSPSVIYAATLSPPNAAGTYRSVAISIDGIRSGAFTSIGLTVLAPPGVYEAQVSGGPAVRAYLELMHQIAQRYATATEAQGLRHIIDNSIFSMQVGGSFHQTSHRFRSSERDGGPNSIQHSLSLSGQGLFANPTLHSPTCQSTISPNFNTDNFNYSMSY
jgi:hypothetical protein